jgi:hypothetical protein
MSKININDLHPVCSDLLIKKLDQQETQIIFPNDLQLRNIKGGTDLIPPKWREILEKSDYSKYC